MKKKWILLLAGMFLFACIVPAQIVTKDSINVLNNDKEKLKIAQSLNEHKLQLAKLQNEVAGRTNDVQQTAEAAQKAAVNNESAASTLTGDAQDKQKARSARKAAKHAQSSAKDARKALDKMDNLNKDIENVKKKIQEEEQKLSLLGGVVPGF